MGNIPEDDWRRTFNLGIGMILAVREAEGSRALRLLKRMGDEPVMVGAVVKQKRGGARVVYQ